MDEEGVDGGWRWDFQLLMDLIPLRQYTPEHFRRLVQLYAQLLSLFISRLARPIMLSRSARIVLTARPLARLYATESASPLSAASPTTDSTPYGGARYNKAERSPTHRDSRTRPPRTSHVARIRQEKFDGPPPHLMTLADLSVDQIAWLLRKSIAFKFMAKELSSKAIIPSLGLKTIALLFSKRSTRTRVASESAVTLLGGHPMFLGSADIQLGVNETLKDSSRVIGSMVDGVMARVGAHEEIEVGVDVWWVEGD